MPAQAQSLSRSTIVLAIATCIPFGLAIKDTVSGKYDRPDPDDLEALASYEPRRRYQDTDVDEEDYRDVAKRRAIEEAQNRAEIAQREHEEQAERARREAKLKTLYGADVASIGSAFEGIRLGEKVTVRPDARALGFDAMLIDNGATSLALWIQPGWETDCRKLGAQLHDAWGAGRKRDRREIWIDERAGMRAVFTPEPCELKFEKIVPLAGWLEKTQSSIVPMWAVGQPFTALKAALGAKIPGDAPVGEQIMWTDAGLGAAMNPTQITAFVERGRVVGLLVSFQTDVQMEDALIARISELTGKQPQDEAPIWKSNPPIELKAGAQTLLMIGKQPTN